MKILSLEEYMLLSPRKRILYRIRQVKFDFPTGKRVEVRIKPYKTLFQNGHPIYGYCTYSKKRDVFTIYIEQNEDASIMVDILWHEYAHILTWDSWQKSSKHCNKFWTVYGTIYRKYQDEA